jgi:predicted nucleotidyltransferase
VLENNRNDNIDRTTLLRLQDYFTREKMVSAAYLFGSRSSGQFGADSDIDIAVILPRGRDAEQAFWELAEIKEDLESAFRPITVDVLDFERIPCRIAHEVLKTGVLIAQSDEDRRVEVEVRRQSEYLDFLPRLKYYRREVLGLDQ